VDGLDGERQSRGASPAAAGSRRADSPPPGRRGLGFFAVCLAYCAIIVDGSVLNVAIPTIREHLGGSMAGAQWVLDGYTLPLAALLLTAGAVGDRIGLRRMLLSGITVFTAASAACASAPDAVWLIGARVAQGAGAAALLPATLALVPHLFTGQAERERATVAWVAAGSVAVAADRRPADRHVRLAEHLPDQPAHRHGQRVAGQGARS
jgi:MFS transporter, DHA2 family, methylenomycin A resistance protein